MGSKSAFSRALYTPHLSTSPPRSFLPRLPRAHRHLVDSPISGMVKGLCSLLRSCSPRCIIASRHCIIRQESVIPCISTHRYPDLAYRFGLHILYYHYLHISSILSCTLLVHILEDMRLVQYTCSSPFRTGYPLSTRTALSATCRAARDDDSTTHARSTGNPIGVCHVIQCCPSVVSASGTNVIRCTFGEASRLQAQMINTGTDGAVKELTVASSH